METPRACCLWTHRVRKNAIPHGPGQSEQFKLGAFAQPLRRLRHAEHFQFQTLPPQHIEKLPAILHHEPQPLQQIDPACGSGSFLILLFEGGGCLSAGVGQLHQNHSSKSGLVPVPRAA